MGKRAFSIFFSLLVIGGAGTLLTSCASTSPDNCQELDWYEIGRRDANKGAKSQRNPVKVVCESSDNSLAEALYHNGFDAGAAQFCDAKNAFQLGRQGLKDGASIANEICPVLMREEFAKQYHRGIRLSQLQETKQNLNRRLASIEASLEDTSLERVHRGLLKGEKLEIETKRKNLEAQISAQN